MDISISKSAKKSIAELYNGYCIRHGNGQTKKQSQFFDSSSDIVQTIKEDIPELKNSGLIKVFLYGDVELTDAAIVYMENLPLSTIKEWISFCTPLFTDII